MTHAATRGYVSRKAARAPSVRHHTARSRQRRFNEPHAPVHGLQRIIGNYATTRLLSLTRLQRQPKGPLDPVPPDSPRSDVDCMINLDADKPQDYVDCCAKAPAGRGCSSHVMKVVCKIPGVDCDKKKKKAKKPTVVCDTGFKPGTTREYEGQCCPETVTIPNPTACCTKDRIVIHSPAPYCCPPGTVPDAGKKECVKPSPPPPVHACLPGHETSKGECCRVPQVARGDKCVDPTPPPAKPPRATPAPIVIFFKQDKPSLQGTRTLANSLTAEGAVNMRALTALLRSDASLKVQLVGKASEEGTDAYNLDLGRRRAEMIAEALASEGVDASRLTDMPHTGLPGGCQDIRSGLVTCGEAGATSEKDRQVLARIAQP